MEKLNAMEWEDIHALLVPMVGKFVELRCVVYNVGNDIKVGRLIAFRIEKFNKSWDSIELALEGLPLTIIKHRNTKSQIGFLDAGMVGGEV